MRNAIFIRRLKGYSPAFALAVVALLFAGNASASRISDIKNTKHNLSVYGPGSVKAAPADIKQTQICIFCHTPHNATLGITPLWNRKLSSATYTPYSSSSLDAETILGGPLGQPGGSSKLCLSCHDGTLAIGNVNVAFGRGTENTTFKMPMFGVQGYSDPVNLLDGKMPFGGSGVASAVTTGYTRNLGIDLSNDHPISVTYNTDLSARDGELRRVNNLQKSEAVGPYYKEGQIIGVRSSGYRPEAPLEPTGPSNVGQVQCGACHDPHLRETDPKLGNQEFLRLNRFQESPPTAQYDGFADIGCIACHDKNFTTTTPVPTNAGTWAYSVHANPNVSTIPQTYTEAAAKQNGFPTILDNGADTNLPVWKASCLNCHDTHSVQGSRWLLREGTDSTSVPKVGGNSAIEETCYLCHSSNPEVENGNPVQDIESDFRSPNFHMPITLADQQANPTDPGNPLKEVHAVGGNFNDTYVDCTVMVDNKCGADGIESRANLGYGGVGDLVNRHAECTDCHNPHRAVKFQSFQGDVAGTLSGTPDAKGTHKLEDTPGYTPTNIASGALRGTFGVEPNGYTSASFDALPASFLVKRGDPDPSDPVITDCADANKADCDNRAYVTREYQICMKCHSNYGYSDNNTYPYNDLPMEIGTGGLTPSGTNGLTNYTNQAREFQAPTSDRGVLAIGDSGAAAPTYSANNQRSWHPVMDSTGRSDSDRGIISSDSPFNLPWSNAVGTQTMYCSDCHGSAVASSNSVIPDSADPTRATWGPHGSSNSFILKGVWNDLTGDGQQADGLCFKCHDYASYAEGAAGGGKRTGFWINDPGAGITEDGHQLHVDRIRLTNGAVGSRCDWCHTAVPHGWKNKALLVNLNDIGPEGGQAPGTEVRNNTTTAYNNAPYYMNAVLKVINFKASGDWTTADCGSSGSGGGNGLNGMDWMKGTDSSPGSGLHDVASSENCMTPP